MVQQKLDSKTVIDATLRASEILSGMGYHGKYGSVHLLRLNIQTNTLTAILHNMIAWQISELDNSWTFHMKGGPTPDLTDSLGAGIQVKVTSNKHIIRKSSFTKRGLLYSGQIYKGSLHDKNQLDSHG